MRLLFCFIVFLHLKSSTSIQSCQCDKNTTVSTVECTYKLSTNNSIESSTCSCIEKTYLLEFDNATNVISCFDPNPGECTDTTPDDGICDREQNLRCTATVLSNSQRNIVKYLFYFVTVWIILWCVITIVVNIMHKNSGHHRFIQLYEELVIIVLIVIINALNVSFQSNKNICKYVAILSHFFMVLLSAAFLMEANFAKSMVHGKSRKNGGGFPALYYILPILIALIPTLITYFTLKTYYGLSYQFCFTTAPGNMFWAFVIPNWILISIAGLQAQLSCLACDKTIPDQDQKQCFWAKRSAKSLLLFSLLLFTLWFLILSAGNEQTFYLFIISCLLALITGPTIFIVHTFCHLNTCQRWGKPGCFGSIYMMCPEKPKNKPDEHIDDDDLAPQEPTPAKSKEPKEDSEAALPNKQTPATETEPDPPKKENKIHPVHTEATHFYSWLTAQDNNARRSSEILFRPKAV